MKWNNTASHKHIRAAQALSGDARAEQVDLLARLILKSIHAELVYDALKVCNNNMDAEDAVSDVYARLDKLVAQYDNTNPRAYIHRCVKNATLDMLRRKSYTIGETITPKLEHVGAVTPSKQTAIDALVDEMITAIKPLHRTTFVEFTLHGLSAAEIEAKHGFPEGTARRHVYRARKEVQDYRRKFENLFETHLQ